MEIERPNTAETLNHGHPSVPRRSASVLLLRDGGAGLEVLLVRRSPQQRVMGGYWVFPGGAVDADEGEGDGADRAAAVRELEEEAGVAGIAPAALVAYSRWITPALIQRRFDTRFFLARAPAGVQARVDGVECVDLRWTTPAAALDGYAAGELPLVFPTLKHLQQVCGFSTVDDLVEDARAREILPVAPKVVVVGQTAHVLLPGEPGYDDHSLG